MDQARLKYRIVGGIVLVALAAILVPVLTDLRQPLPQGPQAIDIPAEPTDGLASRLPADGSAPDDDFPEPQDIPPPAPPPPLSQDDGSSLPVDGGDPLPEPAPQRATPAVPVPPPAPAGAPREPPPAAKPPPVSPPPVARPAPKPTPAAKPAPAPKPAPQPAPVAKAMPAALPAARPVPAPAPGAPAKPATPAAASPVPPAPSAPQQAWVVQLGVFGNLKTAIDLREQLRKAGYSAFTEEIATPHGKALRVRVGPELDRATAQAARDRVARETGHDGIVMTYP